MQFSGFGTDVINLPGGAPPQKQVSPEVFLIAQINRFKGPNVPEGHRLGDVPWSTATGEITMEIAFDALIIGVRRLQQAVQVIDEPGTRTLLEQARAILMQGDASGGGLAIEYVKKNAVALANSIMAFGNALGLPPAVLPFSLFGLSGMTLAVAGAGLVGVLLLLKARS